MERANFPHSYLLNIFPHVFFGWRLLSNAIFSFLVDSFAIILVSSIFLHCLSFSIYKKTIISVWLLNLFSDLVSRFYLTVVSFLFADAIYYDGDNMWKLFKSGIYLASNHSIYSNAYSVLFVVSGVIISSICIFLCNYIFVFSQTNFSKKQSIVMCTVLAVVTPSYSLLLL